MAHAQQLRHSLEKKRFILSEKMQQALASLALEGIVLPEDTLADLELLETGKMTKEQFLKKTHLIAKS
jgi:hypothetical protein